MSDLHLFQDRVSQSFRMRGEDEQTHTVVLTQCAAQPDGSSFALTFNGGREVPAEQGTYLLSADGLEPMPVFLVPARQDATGVELYAVFNQPDLGGGGQ